MSAQDLKKLLGVRGVKGPWKSSCEISSLASAVADSGDDVQAFDEEQKCLFSCEHFRLSCPKFIEISKNMIWSQKSSNILRGRPF